MKSNKGRVNQAQKANKNMRVHVENEITHYLSIKY